MRTEHPTEGVSAGFECVYFDSLDEYANLASTATGDYHAPVGDHWLTLAEAVALARTGWEDALDQVENMTAGLVDALENETHATTFEVLYGVEGCDVDVARYLSGEPECLISYPMLETPRAGRVVTMCASVTYSGGARAETVRARGLVMTAAAFALDRLGLSTELWADRTIRDQVRRGLGTRYSGAISQRVLIKGANDVLDPARVLYAFAHPSMLQCLGFATAERSAWGQRTGQHSGYPIDPLPWLPEGAVYVPTMNTDKDSQDPQGDNLRTLLQTIGVID